MLKLFLSFIYSGSRGWAPPLGSVLGCEWAPGTAPPQGSVGRELTFTPSCCLSVQGARLSLARLQMWGRSLPPAGFGIAWANYNAKVRLALGSLGQITTPSQFLYRLHRPVVKEMSWEPLPR